MKMCVALPSSQDQSLNQLIISLNEWWLMIVEEANYNN